MRFADLRSAGRALAKEIEACGYGAGAVVVLGVARGGVPVAAEVARGLGAPLDVVLIRRLLTPRGPEDPVCAVNVAGALIIDEELAARRAAHDPALEHFLTDALDEFARRERACRGARTLLDLADKTIFLVDNGIRTGSTLRVAIRALRTRGPARVVVAVPVASAEGRAAVEAVSDELVCLATPEPFGHVGMWYAKFNRPDDAEIAAALDESA